MKKRALVCGGSGFIGSHLVKRLISEGYDVVNVDLKQPEFREIYFGETFVRGDLRDPKLVHDIIKMGFDEVAQMAADMGGAGFVFTGENDADIMHNSALINLNILNAIASQAFKPRVFYSSSACIYPERNQLDPNNPVCTEDSAYPAAPDSEYGWEKLFSERLYLSYRKNKKIDCRIARFHNIFGPLGTYTGGREKAPAAICRKVALAKNLSEIEIWGDGKQTRSFLYIDECIEGVRRLMQSDYYLPINIGSDEMVTINRLAELVINISGKQGIKLKHVPGPQGVRGRCSDNLLIEQVLGWRPTMKLNDGLALTYEWISKIVGP
jgi:nucleoside-diphosphate-sugar epimerase